MPSATLLLRVPATTSLTSIVEKSQRNLPPFAEYDLRINSSHLDLVLISSPSVCDLKLPTDEGFESDIDTVSIVSSDDSFTSGNARESLKGQESDSANGSASSDSDTETVIAKPPPVTTSSNESHNLVNCVCYTDIKFPHLLVFVIKCDALVFKFENLTILKSFYTNFSTFKAIANQKTYNTANTKYNLLQRTDRNGITHIEITKELETRLSFPRKSENSNIISLNTPDFKSSHVTSNLKESRSYLKNVNLRQRSESPKNDIHSHENSHRSSSIENILNTQSLSNDNNLKKVWKSAEDLLGDTPKRPERRKKKQKAPDPPKPNILTGQFVRVDVKQSRFQTMTQKILPIKDVLYPQKKIPEWTYSVPRFLRRPRSQSETRNNFTPIDYGYVDFTQNVYYGGRKSEAVSNRLFGMSSKLKDFNTIASKTIGRKYDWENRLETRRGSLGELSYKLNTNGGSLKSVIKKDDNKRKNNEKKVTFSAYTTVQVV
ncbi:hypothetical protein RI129_013080 [Pyrocoelia pectoralis]|uniref:Uncharacterized protein n=1 Tax=Pyrocoelia pectoralis TaxID=417401 RepID=A0AAN7UVG6_9COLE